MTTIQFETAVAFREWLSAHGQTADGAWVVFGKPGGPTTLTAQEALEEALCFGWIDGQIKRVDDLTYMKYFAPRRKQTEWSQRNIALVEALRKAGRMTPEGEAKIEEAQREGRFQPKARPQITPEAIAHFVEQVVGHEPAHENLMKMPPSVHRSYTGYSLEPKSDEAKARRMEKIIERLDKNLKPM